MPKVRLIYASTAQQNVSFSQLTDILRTASPHNREAGVSGLLLLAGQQFLQVLEGERVVVNQLYHRILTDVRHTDLMLIDYAGIRAREFPDWSMKLIRADDTMTAARREVLARHLGGMSFDPATLQARVARALLLELAALERISAHAA